MNDINENKYSMVMTTACDVLGPILEYHFFLFCFAGRLLSQSLSSGFKKI